MSSQIFVVLACSAARRHSAYNGLTMFPPLMIFLLSLAAPTGAQTVSPSMVEPRSLEIRVSELINAERMKEKLKPLKIDPKLSEIARRHSEDMADAGSLIMSTQTARVQRNEASRHITNASDTWPLI
jgi:uncharacterized protein YkwD